MSLYYQKNKKLVLVVGFNLFGILLDIHLIDPCLT